MYEDQKPATSSDLFTVLDLEQHARNVDATARTLRRLAADYHMAYLDSVAAYYSDKGEPVTRLTYARMGHLHEASECMLSAAAKYVGWGSSPIDPIQEHIKARAEAQPKRAQFLSRVLAHVVAEVSDYGGLWTIPESDDLGPDAKEHPVVEFVANLAKGQS